MLLKTKRHRTADRTPETTSYILRLATEEPLAAAQVFLNDCTSSAVPSRRHAQRVRSRTPSEATGRPHRGQICRALLASSPGAARAARAPSLWWTERLASAFSHASGRSQLRLYRLPEPRLHPSRNSSCAKEQRAHGLVRRRAGGRDCVGMGWESGARCAPA